MRWVGQLLGEPVVHHRRLVGATSSEVYRIELGVGPPFVLRLFTSREWLAMEPDLAAHEGAALERAAMALLPAPRVLAVDEAGSEAGLPAVLMTEVAGSVVLRPPSLGSWLDGLAGSLAAIHEIEADDFAWAYRIWQDFDRVTLPSWSQQPGLWERVVDLAQRQPPSGPTRLIHRDFHPTNVLWSAGQVSGVVDWVNACRGPTGVDVAHCRLNLAAMYGVEVADGFSTRYANLTERSIDPIWDLRAVTEWLPECEVYPPWLDFGLTTLDTATVRTRLEEFATTALTRLS